MLLSSKKSTLISCLLKRITSDAVSLRPASLHPQVATCNESTFTSFWRLISEWCSSNESSSRIYSAPTSTSLILEQTKELLKSLSKCELRRLWAVVQSGGREVGECVLVQLPRTGASSRRHRGIHGDEQTITAATSDEQCPISPFNFGLQTEDDDIDSTLQVSLQWRWPSEQIDQRRLRPLPCCHHYALGHKSWRHIKQYHSVCINPHHWALLTPLDYSLEDAFSGQAASFAPMPADNSPLNGHFVRGSASDSTDNHQYYPMPSSTPPPTYSEAFHEAGQVACNIRSAGKSIEPNVRNNSKWCRVAYWEFRERVGDMYSFSSNSVSVAPEETGGDSISLESLFRSHGGPASAEVSKTRTKIGNGVSIFRDAENAVWLYNRSSSTIFVSSRIFLQTTFSSSGSSPSLSIMKLPPGHLIKAYDLAIAQRLRPLQSGTHKSQHNHVFSFSFVKGFGPNYSRQNIMQCPCWMEVILDLASSPSETGPPTVAAAVLARDH